MEKDLKVDSNMPLSNSSQEVTKDLLDMIGEYRGRIGASRRPLSQHMSCKETALLFCISYFSSIYLVDLFCSQQALCIEP